MQIHTSLRGPALPDKVHNRDLLFHISTVDTWKVELSPALGMPMASNSFTKPPWETTHAVTLRLEIAARFGFNFKTDRFKDFKDPMTYRIKYPT